VVVTAMLVVEDIDQVVVVAIPNLHRVIMEDINLEEDIIVKVDIARVDTVVQIDLLLLKQYFPSVSLKLIKLLQVDFVVYSE
jgi:hypothetical protein